MANLASMGDPSTQIYHELLKQRIVVLGTDVNDNVANYISAQLLYLEGQDRDKDIMLYINSPGGSVTAGMAIYDTMQFVNPDVGTICMGLGASMGQFLLCAGAPGKRYALPHARIMMHQPLAGIQGQASDIAIQAEQLGYVKKLLAERIAGHTGQTVHRRTGQGIRSYRLGDRASRRNALNLGYEIDLHVKRIHMVHSPVRHVSFSA